MSILESRILSGFDDSAAHRSHLGRMKKESLTEAEKEKILSKFRVVGAFLAQGHLL